MKRTILLCLLMICIHCPRYLWAGVISGRITDDEGGGLGFASILIKGSGKGTSTNAEGYFNMSLPEGSYTLTAQYIGYKQVSKTIHIKGNENITVNFELQVQGYELEDVVVKSNQEDPAYRIIRNAIKKRSSYLNKHKSFETNIYVKGVLRNRTIPGSFMGKAFDSSDKNDISRALGLDSNGRGVVYLCEQVADLYQSGKKKKLIIRSVKESGNPNGIGLGNVPAVVNFYENNVHILANHQEFVSPISQSALNYYTYKLIGEFEENGQKIYKIELKPKRIYERCFAGNIFIADGDWAIHSLELSLNNKQGLDMLDTFRINQQYQALGKENWVIQHQVFYPTLGLLGFDFSGNFVSVYRGQKVNQPIPDSIFNPRIAIRYHTDANKKDSSYWLENRPVVLEEDEISNYHFKDSIYAVENSPEYREKLRKESNKYDIGKLMLTGYTYTSPGYKTVVQHTPLINDVNFNTIEGLVYAPGLSLRQKTGAGKYIIADNQLRYGFRNTHFNAKSLLSYVDSQQNWKGRYWKISLAGGRYVAPLNNMAAINELINTYASLFEQRNYLKLFERYFAGLRWQRNWANGFQMYLSAQYEHRNPLYNTTAYSWARNRAPYTSNHPDDLQLPPMPEHDVVLAEMGVEYQPGIRFAEFPDGRHVLHSKAPVFSIYYQKGIPALLNSIADFDKWELRIQHQINLQRWGDIEYHYMAGGFLNNKQVPIPDLYHLKGNQYRIAGKYLQTFQMAPYYRFSNQENLYTSLFAEYSLKGLLSNKLPLLRQAHWYFVFGNNTFYAQSGTYYTEAFGGIDNIGYKIFRGIRFDVLKAWDSYHNTYWGIRLGFKLGSSGFQLTETHKTDIF